MTVIRSPKKLIEVALPLDDLNEEASLRKRKAPAGYPTALHKWWAQRPPAAARAVLFAQMVNDPGYESGGGFQRGVNKKEAAIQRERLFDIIRKLVLWGNTNNEAVLDAAREEIRKSWRETCKLNEKHPRAAELFNPNTLPGFYDPFGGSGAIPLEAQRLGLEAHASDLNPVAVLINKAMIEIPPKFAGCAPVGPLPASEKQARLHEDWSGAKGLAEDVRRYGHWMREQAEQRIGHLYPRIEITAEMAAQRPDLKPLAGQQLTVIAWLWARTVRSPNPAYSQVEVPLASTFLLSTKAGKEAWVEPILSGSSYRFEVRSVAAGHGKPPESAKAGTKLSRGANFRCVMSDTPIESQHIYAQANAGRMGARLMAVVAEGARSRVYLDPSEAMEAIARSAQPTWQPDVLMPENPRWFSPPLYGLKTFGDLFTPRQLVALTTFSDLVAEARERIRADALQTGMADDGRGLDAGGSGATAYAEAVATYLAFAASRAYDYGCSIATWRPKDNAMRSGMSKQAIPMTWDFAEGNPFGESSAGFVECATVVSKVVATSLAPHSGSAGHALQRNAAGAFPDGWATRPVISTDPPYYDNIGYADLSDFFYVCLRRILRQQFPNLFSTLAVPKAEELVATPYRHGGKKEAEQFFLAGMTDAMHRVGESSHPAFPITIYYAFKQSETKDKGTASTGWETFLAAVLRAGLSISGTWPVQTEGDNRQVGVGNNALASSIILVCRRRADDAPSISRKDFLRELKDELAEALVAMLGGEGNISPIAPVDLAQAAIGPGMAVFSKYSAVLEANGEPMSVHTALTLINKQVDEALGGENFDADTNFCLGWFQDVGWSAGEFGTANVLAQAKATSVLAVEQAGVITAKGGKVKLLKPADYPTDWDPQHDNRTPVWEALHQLVRALNQGGESAAGRLLARMPERSADIRRLAYWLYTLCERKGWAEDARGYNELVTAWHAIEAASHEAGPIHAQTAFDL
jgi:putative DNA methylase